MNTALWSWAALLAAGQAAGSGGGAAVTRIGDGAASKPAVAAAAKSQSELEREFADLLTNSVLVGTWQLITPDGLSPAREDKYTIARTMKREGDEWIVACRIEYADKDVTVPLIVRVRWIGDTPMIVVDELMVPGIGIYSARVIFQGGVYAGTWFGRGYGGVMSGRVTRAGAAGDQPVTPGGHVDLSGPKPAQPAGKPSGADRVP